MRVSNTDKAYKQFTFFRQVLLFAFLLLFFVNRSNAQAPGMLELEGRAVKDGKPLSGAVITVYRGSTIQQEQIKTGKNGKFHWSHSLVETMHFQCKTFSFYKYFIQV